MWKIKNSLNSEEDKELIRIPTIWGKIGGTILGLLGVLIIFRWIANDLIFGLLFWVFFSIGIIILIISAIKIDNSTPVISKRRRKMKAHFRGLIIGILFGLIISFTIILLMILVLFVIL